jgi:Zinc finger, C2H2 type
MNATQKGVGNTRENPRDVDSHPSADGGRRRSTNVLGKRQRCSGPLDEDLRSQDDDNPLEEGNVTRKETCIPQSLEPENMMQYLKAMGKHIQSLQAEVRALQSRVGELESDSAESNTERVIRRNHLCPISQCGKSFSRYEHLRRHIKDEGSQAHKDFAFTLDRTFCESCQKQFKRPEDCTRHEKRFHLEIFELRHAWTNSAPSESSIDFTLSQEKILMSSIVPPTDEEASAADGTQRVHVESSCDADGSSLALLHEQSGNLVCLTAKYRVFIKRDTTTLTRSFGSVSECVVMPTFQNAASAR